MNVIRKPGLKYAAWDPNDCDMDEAREYTGSSPGEIARYHAEWMHGQGDPQEEYNVRVRTAQDGIIHEWEVCVDVEHEVSFYAAPAISVKPSASVKEQKPEGPPEVTSNTVHYSHEAYQPDVHLQCGRWTTLAWSPRAGLPDLVYQTVEGDLYTFERVELVTCETCKSALTKTP